MLQIQNTVIRIKMPLMGLSVGLTESKKESVSLQIG